MGRDERSVEEKRQSFRRVGWNTNKWNLYGAIAIFVGLAVLWVFTSLVNRFL